jgi:hypothetical protein
MPIINDGKERRMGEDSLSSLLLLIKNMASGFVNSFVQKEYKTGSSSTYKTLTDNDLTDTLKDNYDKAFIHSRAEHAPKDAQANIVEIIKVNGSTVTPENKVVNIAVPQVSSDISADITSTKKAVSPKAVADYVASAVAAGSSLSYKILGDGEYSKDTGLPIVAGQQNIIYLVPVGEGDNNIYAEYLFIGNKFECIGTTSVDLSNYLQKGDIQEFTTEEINAIWSAVMGS